MDRASIVRQQEASGLGIVEYCAQRGIRPNNFYNWKAKLKAGNHSASNDNNRFAKVETQSVVSIELENGVKLKVAVSDLKAVLMALR